MNQEIKNRIINELNELLSFDKKDISELELEICADKIISQFQQLSTLKQLREISDEDAIEVAKILKPENDYEHHKLHFKSTLKGLFNGNMYAFDKCLKAIQYLQSKNYELPKYY